MGGRVGGRCLRACARARWFSPYFFAAAPASGKLLSCFNKSGERDWIRTEEGERARAKRSAAPSRALGTATREANGEF